MLRLHVPVAVTGTLPDGMSIEGCWLTPPETAAADASPPPPDAARFAIDADLDLKDLQGLDLAGALRRMSLNARLLADRLQSRRPAVRVRLARTRHARRTTPPDGAAVHERRRGAWATRRKADAGSP